MPGHGARPRLRAVIRAEHGHGGGEIKRFAQTFERAERDQLAATGREGRRDRDEGPEDETGEDHRFPAEPIAYPTCQRRRELYEGLFRDVARACFTLGQKQNFSVMVPKLRAR